MPAVNNEQRLCRTLDDIVKNNSDLSIAVAAVQALVESIKWNTANTMFEFMQDLENSRLILKKQTNQSPISVSAGCDLFLQWVGKYRHDISDLEACKSSMIVKGENLIQRSTEIRNKVASVGIKFIKNDMTILIHSYSRVVTLLLTKAAKSNIRFSVLVTESQGNGLKASEILKKAGIRDVRVIADAAVGFYMEKVDMVLVGAEGVTENGGVVNRIGTYLTALAANAGSKPLYVVAESYKFARIYPLYQDDLPNNESVPTVDYTPPNLISLLFTDLGILTPTGVSDELIKTYY
ncbi:Translation initiation factor [Nowakowskiella sp. JEL0407]|nr:Translation initiation factor [Nowakowskiella sp. JEL0407]